jgi:hypothetical protein
MRCAPLPWECPLRWPVPVGRRASLATSLHGMREGRMGGPALRHREPVPVTAAFEPTRLAEDALRGAYRALVALPARTIMRGPVALAAREAPHRAEGTASWTRHG